MTFGVLGAVLLLVGGGAFAAIRTGADSDAHSPHDPGAHNETEARMAAPAEDGPGMTQTPGPSEVHGDGAHGLPKPAVAHDAMSHHSGKLASPENVRVPAKHTTSASETPTAPSSAQPGGHGDTSAAHDTEAGPAPITAAAKKRIERFRKMPPSKRRRVLTLSKMCRAARDEVNPRKGMRVCQKLLKHMPGDAEAYISMAHLELARNRQSAALKWAKRATKADPELADAYIFIGGAYHEAGRLRRARNAYKKYLKLAPEGPLSTDIRDILAAL